MIGFTGMKRIVTYNHVYSDLKPDNTRTYNNIADIRATLSEYCSHFTHLEVYVMVLNDQWTLVNNKHWFLLRVAVDSFITFIPGRRTCVYLSR